MARARNAWLSIREAATGTMVRNDTASRTARQAVPLADALSKPRPVEDWLLYLVDLFD